MKMNVRESEMPEVYATSYRSWLSREEGGVCVGVVGMVMANSTQPVFRMFP